MSDIDYDAFKEMRQQKRAELSGPRMDYAIKALALLDFPFTQKGECLHIVVKNKVLNFWPYSGWFQGAGMRGRGINLLIKKLKDHQ